MAIKNIIFLIILGIIGCHSFPTGCQGDEWQCSDGACIPTNARCDNLPDCADGSDEQNCIVIPVCPEGLESCPQPDGKSHCVKKAIGCGCGPPPDIANGHYIAVDFSIGATGNITCLVGYDATKENSVCQITGLWETAACVPKDCGTLPAILHGTITLNKNTISTFGANASVTCDAGYTANTTSISCQSSGQWEAASCSYSDCGPTPAISHGTITLNGKSSIGSSATVTCEDGYTASKSTVTCQSQLTWESTQCTPKDCGAIPAILNGRADLSIANNSTYGAFADITCDPGFETTRSKITCQSSGSWEKAVCNAKDCGMVPGIASGKIRLTDVNNSTFGASADVMCDAGFQSVVSSIACQMSGLWENVVCNAKDCGLVPEIAFGKISPVDVNNTTYGASADVMCNSGFESSVYKIMCQNTGRWETAKCVSKDCGPIPVIAFGSIRLNDNNNTTYGASADVMCNSGFESSVSKIMCQNTGSWETATCSSKDCGPVPLIPFGKISLNEIYNTTYGAYADVTCNSGFESSVSRIMCQNTGSWETATCSSKDCGPVSVIAFGKIILNEINNTTYGASADVTCNSGFETNVSRIMCQTTGLWETATCNSKDCGPVPVIAFGKISLNDNNNTTYGASADVTCNSGFEASVSMIMCQNTGSWETATCNSKDCGPVPIIAFGKISLSENNNTTYGASADVTCDSGFESSVSLIICQNTGTWETATCSSKDCGPVPVIAFGTISLNDNNNTTYGASADVTCNSGFESSVSKIMCQNTGSWETATCYAKDCGSPPSISFGTISLGTDNNSTFGATAVVVCDKNYTASKSIITCQSTGVWETTECLADGCGPVPVISHGTIKTPGNAKFGSFANVTCDIGYDATTPSILCSVSGLWETAQCKVKECGQTPTIKHGRITLIDTAHKSFGDSAFVACDEGYESSKVIVTCQSSGVWETALCKAKDCGPPPMIPNGHTSLSIDNMTSYGAEALVHCDVKYVANISKIKCQSSGHWETALCASESQLSYDKCTEEHGVCTQHIYEHVRLLPLKSSKCRTFCHCAHAGTMYDGSVTYKWVERNCPIGTLFDNNLPSPVCNHEYMVWC